MKTKKTKKRNYSMMSDHYINKEIKAQTHDVVSNKEKLACAIAYTGAAWAMALLLVWFLKPLALIFLIGSIIPAAFTVNYGVKYSKAKKMLDSVTLERTNRQVARMQRDLQEELRVSNQTTIVPSTTTSETKLEESNLEI